MEMRHHKNGHETPADLSKFWVILVVSNPVRYKRRYELYLDMIDTLDAAGITNVITVEQAFGNRPFMVTDANNPKHLQVRSVEEVWHKENMINMGVKHALTLYPDGVREVAWIDADCRSAMPIRDWIEETWHALQHYQFVQMWEQMIDLDANYNAIGGTQPSFMANYVKYGTPTPDEMQALSDDHNAYSYGHTLFGRPGLAWAANIDAFNKVGGLIDFCILGAADWYMAHALVGSLHVATGDCNTSSYVKKLYHWQDLAERWIRRDVGYVKGLVYHDFHGKKVNRGYGTRGKILVDCQFDPDTDLKYDAHGLIQLETWDQRQMQLRDKLRGYFRARNEDSIDL
jgi:hypothetical protein